METVELAPKASGNFSTIREKVRHGQVILCRY